MRSPVREAVAHHLHDTERRGTLSFIGIGAGSVDGSERVDEVVWEAIRERLDR